MTLSGSQLSSLQSCSGRLLLSVDDTSGASVTDDVAHMGYNVNWPCIASCRKHWLLEQQWSDHRLQQDWQQPRRQHSQNEVDKRDLHGEVLLILESTSPFLHCSAHSLRPRKTMQQPMHCC